MVYNPERSMGVPYTDLLSWLFRKGRSQDDHLLLYVDALNPERKLTYSDCRYTVRRLIKGLGNLGIGKGSCVCLHSYNIYYPLIFMAVVGVGAVFVGSNPGFKELELVNMLQSSKVDLIITAPELLSTIRNITGLLDLADERILIFTSPQSCPQGFRSWEELFKHGEEDWVRFEDEKLAKETPACLVTTSGTTGLPKLAVLSHYAWVAMSRAVEDPQGKPYNVKRLIFLPMFHTFAAPLSHLAPLNCGHAAYIMPRYSKSQTIAAVEQLGINEILLVPPMIVDFASPINAKATFLKNIRYVFCGGAPLDRAIIQKMYDLLAPGACLAQVYGMTEAGWMTTTKWPEKDDSGSVGKFIPNVEAQLVNSDGVGIHESGQRGDIIVRGPQLMTGYFNNAKATADSFSDGWLKTGDVGVIDEAGRLFVVGREKELIKVRGWQVSPAELEGILRTHTQILDAAVVGVPHNNSEAPRALIVRGDDSLTEEAIKKYISTLLVGYKHLDGGVCFVESIPKSPSGKILRKLLPVS